MNTPNTHGVGYQFFDSMTNPQWAWAVVFLCFSGCKPGVAKPDRGQEFSQPPTAASKPTPDFTKLADAATAFCADCHVMPLATSFAKRDWPREVQRGFGFYFASGRADLAVPRADEIVEYFATLAPDEIQLLPPQSLDVAAADSFLQPQSPGNSAISDADAVAGASIEFFDWGTPTGSRLMLSDMRGGGIYSSQFAAGEFSPWEVLARLENPCRLHQCALDDDGRMGLLVADLGSFLPADHSKGRVVWMRRTTSESLEFSTEVILAGCGRVADAQAADMDGDGDIDVVVADFGWHETGRLLWLKRVADGPATAASFDLHILDVRPGTVEISLVDINADGRLDIVSLIGQEFESVVAYLNQGDGTFSQPRELYVAPDPAYGSSGIQVVDLDQDGDVDIVYTNGDSFDSFEVKPYHAVHWLENIGEMKFVPHELARLPGVHRAQVVDWDLDNDLDIIACSFLPREANSHFPAQSHPIALAVLENDGMQNFRLRPIQVDRCIHPAICVADLNGDGKPDIAAANFYEDINASPRNLADVLLAK